MAAAIAATLQVTSKVPCMRRCASEARMSSPPLAMMLGKGAFLNYE